MKKYFCCLWFFGSLKISIWRFSVEQIISFFYFNIVWTFCFVIFNVQSILSILSVTKLFARAELTSNVIIIIENPIFDETWWNSMWRSEVNQNRKNIIKFNRSEQFNSKFMGTVKRILHRHIHFNCLILLSILFLSKHEIISTLWNNQNRQVPLYEISFIQMLMFPI